MPQTASVNLTVNGASHSLMLDARTTLLDLLREHLDLTGTKKAAIRASAVLAPCSLMGAASIRA
jgi:aerobic-type carbon monoxide dehydrogenase small subunit (CoxS/CutS family)